MSKIAIVYGTTEGHTAHVVDTMRQALEARGDTVVVARAAEPLPQIPADADGVIVGASVHAGKYQAPLLAFVKANRARLEGMPSAFFQVCLAAAEHSPESETEMKNNLAAFTNDTGWQPATIASFGGLLAWSQYDFFTRLIMRLIVRQHMPHENTHQDHDFTDYDAVRKFAVDFAAGLG
jgi:menaquinone-dependent protoporphyrinogen oxidase